MCCFLIVGVVSGLGMTQKVVEWKTGQLTLDQAETHAKGHGRNTLIEF
jgi:hypothetical protein